jgi:hypothetical protein
MQSGLGLSQSGDLNDQNLKQDIRRLVEDLQVMLEVHDTRWNKPRRKDTKI